jgi:hypothetical protein
MVSRGVVTCPGDHTTRRVGGWGIEACVPGCHRVLAAVLAEEKPSLTSTA